MVCVQCGKKAIGCLSFDIDLPKFGFCKGHKDVVWFKIYEALYLNVEPKFKYPKRSKLNKKKK